MMNGFPAAAFLQTATRTILRTWTYFTFAWCAIAIWTIDTHLV